MDSSSWKFADSILITELCQYRYLQATRVASNGITTQKDACIQFMNEIYKLLQPVDDILGAAVPSTEVEILQVLNRKLLTSLKEPSDKLTARRDDLKTAPAAATVEESIWIGFISDCDNALNKSSGYSCKWALMMLMGKHKLGQDVLAALKTVRDDNFSTTDIRPFIGEVLIADVEALIETGEHVNAATKKKAAKKAAVAINSAELPTTTDEFGEAIEASGPATTQGRIRGKSRGRGGGGGGGRRRASTLDVNVQAANANVDVQAEDAGTMFDDTAPPASAPPTPPASEPAGKKAKKGRAKELSF